MKDLVIGLVVDSLLSDLSPQTKKREYVRKELRKLTKKHHVIGRTKPVLMKEAFEFANRVWMEAQKEVQTRHKNGIEYSTVLVMKQLRPYINSKYKLNPRNWDKLEASYNLSKHIFGSLRVANRFLEVLDQELSRYEYNKQKQVTT